MSERRSGGGVAGLDWGRLQPSAEHPPPTPFTEENVLENAHWPVNYCSALCPCPSLQNRAGATGGGAPVAGEWGGGARLRTQGRPTCRCPGDFTWGGTLPAAPDLSFPGCFGPGGGGGGWSEGSPILAEGRAQPWGRADQPGSPPPPTPGLCSAGSFHSQVFLLSPGACYAGSKEGGEADRGGGLPGSWRSSEKAGLVGPTAAEGPLQAAGDPVGGGRPGASDRLGAGPGASILIWKVLAFLLTEDSFPRVPASSCLWCVCVCVSICLRLGSAQPRGARVSRRSQC